MTQTQGQIENLPQAFASKFAIWIADRVASRLGLLCTWVALNDERARGNDAIVNKDRARTRFIAIDGDEAYRRLVKGEADNFLLQFRKVE
jgi:hypothetical protein